MAGHGKADIGLTQVDWFTRDLGEANIILICGLVGNLRHPGPKDESDYH